MVNLSTIILSYNTRDITEQCIRKLIKNLLRYPQLKFEIIIVDNASDDGSAEMLRDMEKKQNFPNITIRLIFNTENAGYPKGNNQGVKHASGIYILYLNSDVMIENIDIKNILEYVEKHRDIGALTVKVLLNDGSIDPASHRGFPTVWNAFCYFAKLEKLFGNIPFLGRLFGGYHLTYKSLSTIHEIDSLTGAFYLTRKSIVDRLGGFDEDFFMYGEDLDLSFKIKQLGYTIIYYPLFQVLHLKYASGLKTNNQQTKNRTKEFFYNAMKIFYRKHYGAVYPKFIQYIIFALIDFKKKYS